MEMVVYSKQQMDTLDTLGTTRASVNLTLMIQYESMRQNAE